MNERTISQICDRAGKQYWNLGWERAEFPQEIDLDDLTLGSTTSRELHLYFQKILQSERNFSVLEIGCANSVWPAYFSKHFNARADGLDYSEVGCRRSKEIYKHYQVKGNVYCRDLFAENSDLVGLYDYVVSFGVVEHFENTSACLQACSRFLRPGGKIITFIPNLVGLVGVLQRFVDRDVYDVHVPLSSKKLRIAHAEADLIVSQCDYFMSINLSSINSGAFSTHRLDPYLRRLLSVSTKTVWKLERLLDSRFPANFWSSPYVVAVATRPDRAA